MARKEAADAAPRSRRLTRKQREAIRYQHATHRLQRHRDDLIDASEAVGVGGMCWPWSASCGCWCAAARRCCPACSDEAPMKDQLTIPVPLPDEHRAPTSAWNTRSNVSSGSKKNGAGSARIFATSTTIYAPPDTTPCVRQIVRACAA
jgi:hypothetical protein